MLPNHHTKKISLVLPVALLHKIDESAKAVYASRADYIRQALVHATEADEPRVKKAATTYMDPANLANDEPEFLGNYD